MKMKIIWGIIVFIIFTIIGFSIFVLFQLNQLKPEYEGKYTLHEITQPVNISWDSSGVIHVVGRNDIDVIFASGFAAAKERLWQMEISRRVAKGQLSEIFGRRTVEIDKLFLTLGFDSLIKVQFDHLSQESKNWLKNYSNGINTYLRQIGNRLPIEFILMGIEPERWTPQDCLLQNRLMAWFLNFNWRADLLYWALYSKLPEDKFKDLWPRWTDYPSIVKNSEAQRFLSQIELLREDISTYLNININLVGSNNWVIAPQKSQSGSALLANDPHLSLQLPSLWIEMHLKSDNMDVSGFSFPGSPGIIIGRNQNIAWGVTNGMVDDSDYFIEKIDTVKKIYWKDKAEKPLQVNNVVVKVKNEPDFLYTIYRTENGPILNTAFAGFASKQFFSLKWTGWQNSDELLSFIKLANANNWNDFETALRTYIVPAQNYVYADRRGNIGYRLGGKIPIRSYEEGLLPKDGTVSQNKWEGWIPYNKMPHIKNPEKGWIATANNQIVKNYPYYISELWEPPYRINRIEQLINSYPKINLEEMGKIQSDVKCLLAEEILPIILEELEYYDSEEGIEDNLFLLLKNWNFEMQRESVPAAVYEVLQNTLIQEIFADEMGEELFRVFVNLPNFYLRIFSQIFRDQTSNWFDNIKTSNTESRNGIVVKSFQETVAYLKDKYQAQLENWEWGILHQLVLEHPLGKMALTRNLFNRGPFSVSGNGTTVNVGLYPFSNPFKMSAGASLRFLVDWSVRDEYWSIVLGGNSGNFLSDFYDNQIDLWLNCKLKKVSFSNFESRNKIQLIPFEK